MIVAKTGGELDAELHYWSTWPPETAPVCSLNESIVQVARNAKVEIERLRARMKDHEMFRHQHRHCDQMGIALHQIGLLVKRAQSVPPTSQQAMDAEWQCANFHMRGDDPSCPVCFPLNQEGPQK